jgi:hypothetical protein
MFDWWDVLSSVSRVNAWANYLAVFFLLLSATSMAISLKSSGRIVQLKDLAAKASLAPKAIAKTPAAPQAQPPAKAAAQPAPAPAAKAAVPAPAVPVPAQVPPAQAQKANERHLSHDERTKLASVLSSRPKGAVSVTFMTNDPEGQAYSHELASALSAAGWKVTEVGPTTDATNPKGLHFQIKNVQNEPENAKYLIHAFIENGFKPVTELNKVVPEMTLMLVVGHKA